MYSQETYEWKIVQTNIDCLEPNQTTYTIEILKDTMVNDNMYQKTSYKNRHFREADGKVFCRTNESEYLLYDFTLKPNESFEIENKAITVVCLQVEYTADQKKLMVEYSRQSQFGVEKQIDIWIEGMGSCIHPFWIDFVFPNPGALETKVLCFHRNNRLLYLNKSYSDCEATQLVTDRINNSGPEIHVFNNHIDIKTADNNTFIVKIFNNYGSVICTKKGCDFTSINTENLPSGTYIIQLYYKQTSYNYNIYIYGKE